MTGIQEPAYDPATPGHRDTLPVGSRATVRAYVRSLALRHWWPLSRLVLANSVAVVASTVGPYLLGRMVQGLSTSTRDLHLGQMALLFGAALAVQTVFTYQARMRGAVLGEEMLADLREDFLVRAVSLPPSVLERAGTGDVLSRMTTDIDRLSAAMREAAPQLAIAFAWVALLMGALVVTSPLLALTALVAVPLLVAGCRWYYRKAPHGYRSEAAGYAAVARVFAESVTSGRTIEAYRLGDRRERLSRLRMVQWIAWERYTLGLRSVLFPVINVSYALTLTSVLLLGGSFALDGFVSVGELATGALYAQMLTEPVNLILRWYEELQVAQASLGRLIGVHEVPPEETDAHVSPAGLDLRADQVHFGYQADRDVLHGLTLSVRPGTKMALVGASGAGKSTLGRLLAGIYAPRHGEVTMGGAALARMPTERVRRYVALVSQEFHVFVGTVRENLQLARAEANDREIWGALEAVGATAWIQRLERGLDTEVGSAGTVLSPSQAQQIALARLLLADPPTLVLDEATSMLDPRAARNLEQLLARVTEGRTIVAIAHRLHTAHDADVIVVVEKGRISEIGSHDQLIDARGHYATLWRSWNR
ncbi:ABC transporter ATP-binding protein [Streptomyces chartreusis]